MNPMPPSAPSTLDVTVRGACPHDCPDTCALLTTVREGRVVQVQGNPEHSHTAGVLCTKVSRYAERTYHSERVLQPLKLTAALGFFTCDGVQLEDTPAAKVYE